MIRIPNMLKLGSVGKAEVTAVILAGGESRRMGSDKSMLPVGDQPLIKHIAERLTPLFDEVLIGANDVEKYSFLGLTLVPDKELDQGPLMGILSCLECSANDLNIVMACDVPEPDIIFITKMLSKAEGYDIVMPVTESGRCETLFALYRRSIIPHAAELLAGGNRRITGLFRRVKVKFIKVDETTWQRNLNTQDEYQEYVKHQNNLQRQHREDHYKNSYSFDDTESGEVVSKTFACFSQCV